MLNKKLSEIIKSNIKVIVGFSDDALSDQLPEIILISKLQDQPDNVLISKYLFFVPLSTSRLAVKMYFYVGYDKEDNKLYISNYD